MATETAPTETAVTVVGRFRRPTSEWTRPNIVLAVEVVRVPCDVPHHPDRDHDHWYVQRVYPARVLREVHYYDNAGAAQETACWCALAEGLEWDRKHFPGGLVR